MNLKYKTPEGISPGDVFGELTILSFAGRNRRYQALWNTLCSCGRTTIVAGTNMKSGSTRRCNGGRHREKHGAFGTPEYWAWKAMKARCASRVPRVAAHYRDKGISVCEEWSKSFNAFRDHVGLMPCPGMEIDRIDNAKGYKPGNVRWATRRQQMRNTSVVKMLELNGVNKPVIQWAEENGLSVGALRFRIKRGWPQSELLSPPDLRRPKQCI